VTYAYLPRECSKSMSPKVDLLHLSLALDQKIVAGSAETSFENRLPAQREGIGLHNLLRQQAVGLVQTLEFMTLTRYQVQSQVIGFAKADLPAKFQVRLICSKNPLDQLNDLLLAGEIATTLERKLPGLISSLLHCGLEAAPAGHMSSSLQLLPVDSWPGQLAANIRQTSYLDRLQSEDRQERPYSYRGSSQGELGTPDFLPVQHSLGLYESAKETDPELL